MLHLSGESEHFHLLKELLLHINFRALQTQVYVIFVERVIWKSLPGKYQVFRHNKPRENCLNGVMNQTC